eukprot:1249389-Pyramimonas_sp.AAC.1
MDVGKLPFHDVEDKFLADTSLRHGGGPRVAGFAPQDVGYLCWCAAGLLATICGLPYYSPMATAR